MEQNGNNSQIHNAPNDTPDSTNQEFLLSQRVRPNKKKSRPKKKKPAKKWWAWSIIAFFVTLILSCLFTLASNSIISSSQIVLIIVVLCVLLAISIIFDIIGVAVASCDSAPFHSKASRKVYGARMSLMLLKHADKVSSICNDIIGDICGIVSGSCGAALALSFGVINHSKIWELGFWVPIIVSSIISAVTVGGKAFFKHFALSHAENIVAVVGKILSVFQKRK